jgi:hypothetical protein
LIVAVTVGHTLSSNARPLDILDRLTLTFSILPTKWELYDTKGISSGSHSNGASDNVLFVTFNSYYVG